MSNEGITALQAAEKAAKRRRTEHYKDWYVRENGRLIDENDRLKQTLNRLKNRGFWARVFNR